MPSGIIEHFLKNDYCFFDLDYVLAYTKETMDDPNRIKNEERRKEFEKNLKRMGMQLEYEDNTVYMLYAKHYQLLFDHEL